MTLWDQIKEALRGRRTVASVTASLRQMLLDLEEVEAQSARDIEALSNAIEDLRQQRGEAKLEAKNAQVIKEHIGWLLGGPDAFPPVNVGMGD